MSSANAPLRIGIDATPAIVAPRIGVEKYAVALIQELAALQSEWRDLQLAVYLHTGNPFACPALTREVVGMVRRAGVVHRLYAPRRGYGLALSLYTVRDRLHLLHELRTVRPWFRTCPYVTTVCDVRTVVLSEGGRLVDTARLSAADRQAILGADGLIAISDSVGHELRAEFGSRLRAPIHVIHLGYDPAFSLPDEGKRDLRHLQVPEKYILFVGISEYHKNVACLVEAFARLREAHQVPHKLVLAGPEGSGAHLVRETAAVCGVQDQVVRLGYVPDGQLKALYAGADVFAFPSLHEGFGIPLLEAMASGAAVVTSRLSAMPEVAGDAALYVDAHDASDIAAGLWRALSDQALRRRLIARGRARVGEFSWRRTALETLQFYRSQAGLGPRTPRER